MITAKEAKALTMDNEATTDLPIWFGQIEDAINEAIKKGEYYCSVEITLPQMPRLTAVEQRDTAYNHLTALGYECLVCSGYYESTSHTFHISWDMA